MKRPAVFFDRDNTLIANEGYLGDPAKVELITGAADAIAGVRALGYATIIVSNQSGVARGLFTEDDVRAVDARMDSLLLAENPAAIVDRHEFCPFHPDAVIEQYRQDSPLRKPKPGMLLAAAEAMALDLGRSWVIGDAPRDIAAGRVAGCRTILFCDPELSPSPAAKGEESLPDYTVTSLADAVHFIASSVAPIVKKPPNPVLAVSKPTGVPSSLVPQKPSAPSVSPPPSAKPAASAASPKTTLKPIVIPKPEVAASPSKTESLTEQILIELRRQNNVNEEDFSVSKLLAGIVQVLVLATLLLGYLQARGNAGWLQIYVLVALTLQTMTIALLIMSRQK